MKNVKIELLGLTLFAACACANARDLPSGYIRADWIRGDGVSARIVTDYTPKPLTDQIRTEVTLPSVDRAHTLWCARGSSTTDRSWTLFWLAAANFRFDYYNSNAGAFGAGAVAPGVKYTITATNNTVAWSGGAGYTYTSQSGFSTAGGPVMLFASYSNGTGSNLGNYSDYKLYSFKVWRSGSLIHDYVPVIDAGGVPMLYDVSDAPSTLAIPGGVFTAGTDDADFTVDAIPDQTYLGLPVMPSAVVRDAATGAVLGGGEYDLVCYSNDAPGTARAVISGKGSHTGLATTTFRIAKVLRVTPTAPENGAGGSWADAMNVTNAFVYASTSTVPVEVWIAGTIALPKTLSYSFPQPTVLRGGFAGTETDVSERVSGARSVLDGQNTYDCLDFSNGATAPVTLDSLFFTRGTDHGVRKTSSAGDLTVTNCAFNLNGKNGAWGSVGNTYSFTQPGGGGANFIGTAAATLRVIDSDFSGNTTSSDNDCGSGGGANVSTFNAVYLDRCTFNTNNTARWRGGYCAGLSVYNAKVIASNCSFLGNRISAGSSTTVHLEGSCGNSVFRNCLFAGNTVGSGPCGVLHANLTAASDPLTVENCTFAYNFCPANSALSVGKGAAAVTNCIFFGNVASRGASRGADLYCTANGTAAVGYSLFGGSGYAYWSSATEGTIDIGTGCTLLDPCFVTSADDFKAIAGVSGYPQSSYTQPSYAAVTALDLHLLSPEGYLGNDGVEYHTESVMSPAIDAGDPSFPVASEPAGKNGNRINLGAYGGTAAASKTPACAPAVSGAVTVSFDGEYTQPTVRFTLGGTGVYIASVVVKVSTDGGTTWSFVSAPIAGQASGGTVEYLVPEYFQPGASVIAKVELTTGAGATADGTSAAVPVAGTLPPWYGKGGGANVVHVRVGAAGRGDGTSWSDAVPDFYAGLQLLSSAKTELWFAGTNVTAAVPMTYSFSGPVTIRGGFLGVENTAAERSAGLQSVLDGAENYNVFLFYNSAALEIDRMIVKRGSERGIRKYSSAGSLTLRDCKIIGCGKKGRMNDLNNSGNVNVNQGGSGASLVGTSAGTLTITNCVFEANTVNGEWCSSGMGAFISGFNRAYLYDTEFVTNYVTKARDMRAGALQLYNQPATLKRCSFRGNQSKNRVIGIDGTCGGTVFENCAFLGNRGMYLLPPSLNAVADTLAFTNCTFAYNYSDSSSTLPLTKGTFTVKNSIFHANVIPASLTTVGADLDVALNARAGVDHTLFGGDSTNYVSAVSNEFLTVTCSICADPLFVTTTESFTNAAKVASLPKGAYTAPSYSFLAGINCHLRGKTGYRDETTGETVAFPMTTSPALDAGDPASDYANEPKPNGHRVNLGFYGNTPWATMTPAKGVLLLFR